MTDTIATRNMAHAAPLPLANPEQRKIAAYPLFDWLRFVLASVVVLVHAGARFPAPLDGNLAVCVFLALSGWLIGGILLETQRAELPRFFYNRATRIWCPYFATVILLYGLAAAVHGVDANWFKYLFYDASFTHYTWTVFPRASGEMPLLGTGNHFWSISVEEQFYLFAPLLMLFLAWGKRLWVWLVVAALLLLKGSQFTPIALGVVAAIVHRDHGTNAAGVVWNARYRGPAIAAVVAVALFVAAAYWPIPQVRALLAVAVVLAAAIPGTRGAVGVFVGAISYPLYLNHWIGGFAVHSVARRLGYGPSVVQEALSYLLAIPVAIVAWYLIDRQVMAHRNAWYTPQRGRALGITAYVLLAIGLVGGLLIRRAGG
ncbi:acyltransferase family protein [Sphingomonas sp. PAMC 26621]|uniref:acyltransferase family protein n=1 Tax=Sphingomonas sp. PAMC 26621 TaxID=1112213 RepID=UPI000289B193|nr:acyltransferase [Sphingomonas sp. PAMC 26621]